MSETPSITRDDVAHLARLARIDVPPEQLDHYAEQLQVILGAVAQVSEVASDGRAPDEPPAAARERLPRRRRAAHAVQRRGALGRPSVESERFRVPRILDEE